MGLSSNTDGSRPASDSRTSSISTLRRVGDSGRQQVRSRGRARHQRGARAPARRTARPPLLRGLRQREHQRQAGATFVPQLAFFC